MLSLTFHADFRYPVNAFYTRFTGGRTTVHREHRVIRCIQNKLAVTHRANYIVSRTFNRYSDSDSDSDDDDDDEITAAYQARTHSFKQISS